ncbi:hypothetical protein P3S26_24215, partial [Enterobacter hormaechei]|nr:hypothetical protein [Enterobacter hormaechei]
MELSLNIGLSEKKSNTAALFKTKSAKVILFVLLTVLFCGLAYAGSDDGALGNDSNLLIVFYVQIMPDDFVMQLHR